MADDSPKQSWSEWSDKNGPAIEAIHATPAEPCSDLTGQARALAVTQGSATDDTRTERRHCLGEAWMMCHDCSAKLYSFDGGTGCVSRMPVSTQRSMRTAINRASSLWNS